MNTLEKVIADEKIALKAWNKDVFSDQEFADILEKAMYKTYLLGRNDAVDFIDKEFNDDRYSSFSEVEDGDTMSTEEEAEFRMFWTDLLKSARTNTK